MVDSLQQRRGVVSVNVGDLEGGGDGGGGGMYMGGTAMPGGPKKDDDDSNKKYSKGAVSFTSAFRSMGINLTSFRTTGSLVKPVGAIVASSLFFMLVLGSLWYIALVLSICCFGALFALFLCSWVLTRDDGTPEMRRVSDPIREGAEGFLYVQYSAIARIALGVAGVIFLSYALRGNSEHAQKAPEGVEVLGNLTQGVVASLTFLLGAFCSGIAGYVSMWVSAQSNIRVASAARGKYSEAFLVCFRGGAFSAILALTLCITGVTLVYVSGYILFVLPGLIEPVDLPVMLVGYGFGASFVALFMQLGGGIYTKAADVGADLVGKVEMGIPEDDPRNPAVIADLVGDMVGDCVGSSADVFESIAAEIIGAMILGASLAKEAGVENPVRFVFFPVVIHAFDIVVSSIGIMLVKADPRDDEDGVDANPMTPLKRGYLCTILLAFCDFCVSCRWLLYSEQAPGAWMHFVGCGMVGMLTSYVFVLSTQYYTDYEYAPVRSIAAASTTGHGTNIITGVAVGMKSTVVPTIMVSIAVLTAYHLGASSGLGDGHTAGLFGTAVATMGLLCSAGFVLSMNNYGPIADNAGGIAEMSQQPERVRVCTDRLDAAGNVTKAITKGYSIGSASLACFVLFGAFMDDMGQYARRPFESVDISTPEVLVGGLLGVMMIFLIVGLAVAAVGKTAGEVVKEVRRQFKEHPEIMEWKAKPDSRACVELVTRAALREMRFPGVIAVAFPTFVGIFFRFIGEMTGRPLLGAECLGGFMMFATVTGILMALFLDNVGGAWDNAKKYIEVGNFGGKGSEAHKASITGDTVGDPFKDTAGPALHVVIKLLSTTSLVLAPLFVGVSSS